MDDSELRIHDKIELLNKEFDVVVNELKILNKAILMLLVAQLGTDGTQLLRVVAPAIFPEQTIRINENYERQNPSDSR
jgi:hypothetical protein